MSNSYLWKVSFMCWLAATIGWLKNALCVGVNWEKLWARLKELQRMARPRDPLRLRLGAAKSQYPSGWRLVKIEVGQDGELSFGLRKDKLRQTRQREGRYLLRSNLGSEPTWAAKIPLNFGSSMSCSPRSRKRSKISKVISPCGRSFTN